MEFGLTESQRLLRTQTREFVEDQIIGENHAWDDGEHFPTDVLESLSDMGLIGMMLSEDHGGEDLDPVSAGVVFEELGRGDVALTMVLMLQNLANRVLALHGSPDHVEIARENARGETLLSWGLTEPEQGSDAQAIQTSARREGDSWVVDGEKTAITAATVSDHIVLYARRTESDEIGVFLVPLDSAGVEVTPYHSIGSRVSGWGQVYLDSVELPASALITERDGFKIAMEQFDIARGWIPLFCLGAARQTVDETQEYLSQRDAFGRPIAEFQGPQFELAEMLTKIECVRLKAYESLWRARAGEPFTEDVAMAKWFGTEVSQQVIHDCMILHGHYGFSEEFGLGRRLQDVIGLEIGEGPPQIQKLIIARERLHG